MGSAADRARSAMVDAAERLMAERGIEAVPLRDVLVASGQRNKSAAQYHFGSREGLIRAIIETRMAPVNAARGQLLAETAGSLDSVSTEDLVRALVDPLADATVRRPDTWYARFLARSHTDPVWAQAVGENSSGDAFRRWRKLVEDHLVAIPPELRRARIDRAVSTAIHTLAQLEGRRTPAQRREARIADLVDCIVASLEAPISPRTCELLARSGITDAAEFTPAPAGSDKG